MRRECCGVKLADLHGESDRRESACGESGGLSGGFGESGESLGSLIRPLYDASEQKATRQPTTHHARDYSPLRKPQTGPQPDTHWLDDDFDSVNDSVGSTDLVREPVFSSVCGVSGGSGGSGGGMRTAANAANAVNEPGRPASRDVRVEQCERRREAVFGGAGSAGSARPVTGYEGKCAAFPNTMPNHLHASNSENQKTADNYWLEDDWDS